MERKNTILLLRSASRNFPLDLEPELLKAGYDVVPLRGLESFIASAARRRPFVAVLEIGTIAEVESALAVFEWQEHMHPAGPSRFLLLMASKNISLGERADRFRAAEIAALPQPTRNILFKLELQHRLLRNMGVIGVAKSPGAGDFSARFEEGGGDRQRVLVFRGQGRKEGAWRRIDASPSGKVRWRWICNADEGKPPPAESSYEWLAESREAPSFDEARSEWSLKEPDDDLLCFREGRQLFSAARALEEAGGSKSAETGAALADEAPRASFAASSLPEPSVTSATVVALRAREGNGTPAVSGAGGREDASLSAAEQAGNEIGATPPASQQGAERDPEKAPSQGPKPDGERSGTAGQKVSSLAPEEERKAGGREEASSPFPAEGPAAACPSEAEDPPGPKAHKERDSHRSSLPPASSSLPPKLGRGPEEEREPRFPAPSREAALTQDGSASAREKIPVDAISALPVPAPPPASSIAPRESVPAPAKASATGQALTSPSDRAEALPASGAPPRDAASSPARQNRQGPASGSSPSWLKPQDEAGARPSQDGSGSSPPPGSEKPSPVSFSSTSVVTQPVGLASLSESAVCLGPAVGDGKVPEPHSANSSGAGEIKEVPPQALAESRAEKKGAESTRVASGPGPSPTVGEGRHYLQSRLFHLMTLAELGDRDSSWQPVGRYRVYLAAQQRYFGMQRPADALPLWVYDGELAPEFIDGEASWKFYDRRPVRMHELEFLPAEVREQLYLMCGLTTGNEEGKEESVTVAAARSSTGEAVVVSRIARDHYASEPVRHASAWEKLASFLARLFGRG